jgi:hypothetical protein
MEAIRPQRIANGNGLTRVLIRCGDDTSEDGRYSKGRKHSGIQPCCVDLFRLRPTGKDPAM